MNTIQKFQDLLKRLFQFETSDLDFGIYRILNYKREQIEKFIQEDLKNKVESAFAKHKGERLTNINQRFEEAKQKVIQGLGTQAFTPTGELISSQNWQKALWLLQKSTERMKWKYPSWMAMNSALM